MTAFSREKLSFSLMPANCAALAAANDTVGAAVAPAEEKKEDTESEDDDMGFGIFE